MEKSKNGFSSYLSGASKSVKNSLASLKSFDIFGVPIFFWLDRKSHYQSYFGAVVSLFIKAISLYFFIIQMIGWWHIQNSTVIYSSEEYTVNGLLNSNQSFNYPWDNHNFNLYFGVWARLPDGTELNFTSLKRYFYMEYTFLNSTYEGLLDSEACNRRVSNEYLNLAYDPEAIKENDVNSWRICLKDPINVGAVALVDTSTVLNSILSFQIGICKNSTMNNTCAPIEEIKFLTRYMAVQASIPKATFDFKNKSNPHKKGYKIETYRLDWNFYKIFRSEINPVYIYKDYGLFSDDYQLDSITYSPGNQLADINSKIDDDAFFQYDIFISFQTNKYYMRNDKINDIVSSFGGFFSILYNLGFFICYYLNNLFLKKSLLFETFNVKRDSKKKLEDSRREHSQINNKNSLKTASDSLRNLEEKPKFSLKNIFSCCRKRKKKNSLKKPQKNLYDYIDMRRLIKRLQDVENLKKVIFTDAQRYFFDQIPKPDLNEEIIESSKRKSNIFGLENIITSGRASTNNLKTDIFSLDDRIQNLMSDNEVLSSIPDEMREDEDKKKILPMKTL